MIENHSPVDGLRTALVPLAKGVRLSGIEARWELDHGGTMGEGPCRSAWREPHAGKRRPAWAASSPKTGPKWIGKGLVDFSTMSKGCPPDTGVPFSEKGEGGSYKYLRGRGCSMERRCHFLALR